MPGEMSELKDFNKHLCNMHRQRSSIEHKILLFAVYGLKAQCLTNVILHAAFQIIKIHINKHKEL